MKADQFAAKCYDEKAEHYRRVGDKKAIQSAGFQTYKYHLRRICEGFAHKIDVLDLACGTGRYFGCLRNVRRLIGIDLSFNMLLQAIEPIGCNKMDVQIIGLIAANIHDAGTIFSNSHKFDFIYSIGAFAEYTELTVDDLNCVYELLRPNGKIFITTVNRSNSFVSTSKSAAKRLVYLLSHGQAKEEVGLKWGIVREGQFAGNRFDFSAYYLSLAKLKMMMKKSKFPNYRITSFRDEKHLHNVIMATKP